MAKKSTVTTQQITSSFSSELRLDTVSNDWVVIASARARRLNVPRGPCPFCKIDSPKNVIVLPNKYPAFLPYVKLAERKEGKFYKSMNAAGFQEVVAMKDHKKSLGQLKTAQVKELIDVYQDRYLALMNKKFVNYISIFHNHGQAAGASLAHPHSQIITSPLVDVDLNKALINSKNYYQKTGKCIYCQMSAWEKKARKRIVFENEDFLVICPFASKAAFEMIISPKNHLSYFERIHDQEKWRLAEALRAALNKLYKVLDDPAYNFYLHTSPCDGKDYSYYHWHWTIVPKTAVWAGFEIGTRMEISTVKPEAAAACLRKQ